MLIRFVHALVTLILLGSSAIAGPWLRTPGTHFLSLSVEGGKESERPDIYGALYYEYGLRPKLTLGVDAGHDSWDQPSALLFARVPLWESDSGSRAATELATGVVSDAEGTHLALRAGVSWGRSLSWGQGGWVSIDANYALAPSADYSLAKLEGTLGFNRSDRWKYLLQVIAEKPKRGDSIVSATPGLAWKVGNKSHLLGGIILRSDGSAALKLGLWRDF